MDFGLEGKKLVVKAARFNKEEVKNSIWKPPSKPAATSSSTEASSSGAFTVNKKSNSRSFVNVL